MWDCCVNGDSFTQCGHIHTTRHACPHYLYGNDMHSKSHDSCTLLLWFLALLVYSLMAIVKTEFSPSSGVMVTTPGSNQSTNSSDLVYENYVLGVSGIILAPVVLTLLILVVCVRKAYKTTLQRLIFYSIIITCTSEVSFALQIILNFHTQRWLCILVIYLYLYAVLSWYVYITCFH